MIDDEHLQAEYERLIVIRDELILQGVDPDELLIPLPPDAYPETS